MKSQNKLQCGAYTICCHRCYFYHNYLYFKKVNEIIMFNKCALLLVLIVVWLRQCFCYDYNFKNIQFYMTEGLESVHGAYCTFTECCTDKYIPADITGFFF